MNRNVNVYIALPSLIKEKRIQLDTFHIDEIDYIPVNLSIPSAVKCSDIYSGIPFGTGILINIYEMNVPVDEIYFPDLEDSLIKFPDWADGIIFVPYKYFNSENIFGMYRLKVIEPIGGFVHCECERSGVDFYYETDDLKYVDTINKFEFII